GHETREQVQQSKTVQDSECTGDRRDYQSRRLRIRMNAASRKTSTRPGDHPMPGPNGSRLERSTTTAAMDAIPSTTRIALRVHQRSTGLLTAPCAGDATTTVDGLSCARSLRPRRT